jgi:hypothetical protein
MVGSEIYTFHMGNTPLISSNGSGIVNSSLAVNVVALISEFTSFATIFDEFFVGSMRCDYMPISRYQYPAGTLLATQAANQPMTVSALYHGAGAYINTAGAMNNPTTQWGSTGDPLSITWRNNENPNSEVVVASSTSSSTPTQGWCLTSATPAQAYTGFVQYLTTGTTPLALSTPIGSVGVRWTVMFRARA